jgi:transcriptional activator SPT7
MLSNNAVAASIFEAPPSFEPLTIHNVKAQIGLVQNFFLAKLHANNDEPLIEDDDLPVKQRFPKPRLPNTGVISSPRKRPLKEQGGNAKKKKKVEGAGGKDAGGEDSKANLSIGKGGPVGRLKLSLPNSSSAVPMERVDSSTGKVSETERDDGSAVGMISPESIVAG